MSREVRSPTLEGELRHVAPWLALSLLVWGLGVGWPRLRPQTRRVVLAPWQHTYLELDEAQQRLYRAIREGIFEAENRRAETGAWPSVESLAEEGIPPFAPDGVEPLRWSLARQGVYVNYVGEPESGGLRWLVLFIEPEQQRLRTLEAPGTAPPVVDEEHHALPDGTALHVTVWTQPVSEVRPRGVLAFPVAEGWTQRVGQEPGGGSRRSE